jgi:hypothetical protein
LRNKSRSGTGTNASYISQIMILEMNGIATKSKLIY